MLKCQISWIRRLLHFRQRSLQATIRVPSRAEAGHFGSEFGNHHAENGTVGGEADADDDHAHFDCCPDLGGDVGPCWRMLAGSFSSTDGGMVGVWTLTAGINLGETVDDDSAVDAGEADAGFSSAVGKHRVCLCLVEKGATYNPPSKNMHINLIFCSNGCCNPQSNGIGRISITKSVVTLQTAKMVTETAIGKQCLLACGSHSELSGTHWIRAPRPWTEL